MIRFITLFFWTTFSFLFLLLTYLNVKMSSKITTREKTIMNLKSCNETPILFKHKYNQNILNKILGTEVLMTHPVHCQLSRNPSSTGCNLVALNHTRRQLHFITYGDDSFKLSRQRLLSEARKMGVFATSHAYSKKELQQNANFLRWKQSFLRVWNSKRGGGYWSWKPYIVNETIHKIPEGDVLVYADAGCTAKVTGVSKLYNYIESIDLSIFGVLSFQLRARENVWTTAQIFQALNVTAASEHAYSGQYHATVLIFINNLHARNLISKWVRFVHDHPTLISDDYNNLGQISSFKENRHDQSVFSVLRKIYGSVLRQSDFNQANVPFIDTRIRQR